MTNYDGSTGTSGTLRMVINQSGSHFDYSFQIINTSAPTNVGALPWSANVGGVIVDGFVAINGSGTYTVHSGSIDQYGTVPFQMWIGASGTSGLGGPSTVGPVNLNGGSSSSIPGKVPGFQAPTSMRFVTEIGFVWDGAAANGSAINAYQIQIATDSAFNNQVTAPTFDDALREAHISAGITQNTAYYARIRAKNGVGWGPWSASIKPSTDPAAPNPMTVTAQTPQTASLAWDYKGGTAGPSTAQYQLSPNAQSGLGDFTGSGIITRSVGGTNPEAVLSDILVPGVKYWGHVRMRNGSDGWGTWTDIITFTQPVATAPTLLVVPSADGRSATLTATAPPGITVTSYRAQRRVTGTTTPVVDIPFTGTSIVVTGLTPGSTNDWRLAALFTGGESPYSAYQPVFQPSTNTNPGDYFDGSTPAKPDTSYSWDGTANNSTSKATSFPPLGWRTFDQGNATSGGTGVTIKITGGIFATHAARTTFWTDTTAPGFHGGTGFAAGETFDVQANGTYAGSIYVSPSRDQRMAGEIAWLNAARAVIGYSTGTAQIVSPSEAMTRLSVTALAPAGAVFGAVGWTDVAGDGWSAWHAGDTVTADGAMITIGGLIPYFDGATVDTTQFDYAWLGAVNASISERTTLDFTPPDPLLDPDCDPIPAPPTPPPIADDCIVPEGTWRRYWAVVGAENVSEWLDLVPTLTVGSGADAARQVRIRYWENPDNLLPDQFQQTTGWAAEQIISYMPPNTDLTIDGVSERVWASVNGGGTLAADKLLYGTNGAPATWPVLSCGIGYLISLDVPLDAAVGNTTVDVALTRRM